jgi:hypothetical protein
MAGWIVVIAVLAFASYLVSTYNKLVAARKLTRDSWGELEGQLTKRQDLASQLAVDNGSDLSAALDAVGGATSTGTFAQRVVAENQLAGALGRLLADSPRTGEAFLDMEAAIGRVEEDLQTATGTYNNAARALNTLADSFPAIFVAGILHIAPTPYFELQPSSALNR